jgi:hypothetical protein
MFLSTDLWKKSISSRMEISENSCSHYSVLVKTQVFQDPGPLPKQTIFFCVCVYFIIVVLGVGTLWHLQKFLQHIIVNILSIVLLYPPLPHSWNSFNISTTFSLLHPLLISSPLPLVPSSKQDLFYLPIFWVFFFSF